MACIISSDMFSDNITPEKRKTMLLKMFSSSEKLRNHILSYGWIDGCKICLKVQTWAEIFIQYEKENNKELDIGKIIDDEFVEKVFLEDDLMMVI